MADSKRVSDNDAKNVTGGAANRGREVSRDRDVKVEPAKRDAGGRSDRGLVSPDDAQRITGGGTARIRSESKPGPSTGTDLDRDRDLSRDRSQDRKDRASK